MSIIGPNVKKLTSEPDVNVPRNASAKNASTLEQIDTTNASSTMTNTDQAGLFPNSKIVSRGTTT